MLLPARGRWHLVNPWSPFANNPPFAVIEVDLVTMSGTAFYYFVSAPLTKINKLSPSRFGALYQMRAQKGLFEAEAKADGSLDITFIGTVKTQCNAFLVHRRWDVKRIAILTSVGNSHLKTIPGHTAIAIDGTVYSFEFPHFKVGTTAEYFARPDNMQRPIVVQELNCSMLDTSSVLDYIRHMVDDDIYFFRHNWCSYQVAMALKHGNEKFEPAGIDTPWEVYTLAKSMGLVTRSYFVWDPSKSTDADRGTQWENMSGGSAVWQENPWGHVYAGVAPGFGQTVRDW